MTDNALHFFSTRLLGLLRDRHIKKTDFAKQVGIAPTTLSGYFSEKHSPDLDTLTLICDTLDISSDYLLGRTDRIYMDSSTFSPAENKMLSVYKQLSDYSQYEALGEARMLLKIERKEKV